ncbi:MAG: hypothetical protein L3J62_03915 [Gammaproteobacteria bacterium]|nr:hypothetical protein [Gammaproteobacteria bacterium]MCF6229930.1 hypothetical protein [Gammaproteobacteria bacterium]
MSKMYKKSNILIITTLFILSGCGGVTAKAGAEHPTEVAVTEVIAPPKPVAQVAALGGRHDTFLMEQLGAKKATANYPTIERIEFNSDNAIVLAQAPTEPAGAPVGMGRAPANAEALKAMVSEYSVNKAPVVAPANKVDVARKLRFARMMLMTKSGRRISNSDNQEAKLILKDVANKLDKVERQIARDQLLEADATLGEALRLFNLAGRMVPSEELKMKWENAFPGLKEEVAVAKDLHKRNYEKLTAQHGMGAGVNYDHKSVKRLEQQAEQQASKGDYIRANESLGVARDMIQAAIRQMMTGRKIVYELNLDTPEAEFKYELNKYIGYEELIPIAIEQKNPSKGIRMLAMRHVHEAKRMADTARKTATETDYPKAIRMLQDATAEIRKALKLLGVPSIG